MSVNTSPRLISVQLVGLDEDLGAACRAALAIPRARARDFSLGYTWAASARQFLANVARVRVAGGAVP